MVQHGRDQQPFESISTSVSMLDRAKLGDEQAWCRLVDLYAPLIYQICRRKQIQSQDSADIVQLVFQRLFKSLHRFEKKRAGDSFRAWLTTVTTNILIDTIRKRANQPTIVDGEMGNDVLRNTAEAFSEDELTIEFKNRDAQSQVISRMLKMIQPEFENRTWQAFWKLAIDEESAPEIGDQLGMSAGAVRNAKYKVMRRLRQEFGDLL